MLWDTSYPESIFKVSEYYTDTLTWTLISRVKVQPSILYPSLLGHTGRKILYGFE